MDTYVHTYKCTYRQANVLSHIPSDAQTEQYRTEQNCPVRNRTERGAEIEIQSRRLTRRATEPNLNPNPNPNPKTNRTKQTPNLSETQQTFY
ncbi:hypothetical protein M5D96_003741 [Drosophila gunungcola]|uniref:Uncharacterized protein n=1 Tax=Drosophila gunungcola TaxID=103775 RepID=A0A9P9YTE6_9MUSC|nr:hypothetical protein M5D96_003741 [Drosophila gunungcola]